MKKYTTRKLSADERERQKQEEFRRLIAEEERMRHQRAKRPIAKS